jgi:hypothetical protein
VEGDWPALFDGPSRTLHAVFLGDAHVPDVSAGVLELIEFPDSSIPTSLSDPAPTTGLFQLSFFLDVEATLRKLADLGLGGPPRRVAQSSPNGPITIATVRDPDGVLVLLTPGSLTQRQRRRDDADPTHCLMDRVRDGARGRFGSNAARGFQAIMVAWTTKVLVLMGSGCTPRRGPGTESHA